MSFDDIGKGFVLQYYQCLCTNRAALTGVYRDVSLMTWAGEQLQGVAAIAEKIASLSFQTAQFKPDDIDCQPSLSGGVLIAVNGDCHLDAEAHPLKFNDVFELTQDQQGWYISNHIFRIVGGSGA